MFTLGDMKEIQDNIEKHSFLTVTGEGFWVSELECFTLGEEISFKGLCNEGSSCELNLVKYPSGWWK